MWGREHRPRWRGAWLAAMFVAASLGVLTISGLADLPQNSLDSVVRQGAAPSIEDRRGLPLNRTYQGQLNAHDLVALHDVPDLLGNAFIIAEDSRFYTHHGADWLARIHAAWQNLKALRVVRGASTITEQAVRILWPRKRTYWSRWLEGWDAMRLERRFSKPEIFEFYLNQVPFSANRRGIVQAARFYFGRSLDTLNTREMLALAAMVRAPSLLEPSKAGAAGLDKRISQLAGRMLQQDLIPQSLFNDAIHGPLAFHQTELAVRAPHFLAFVRERLAGGREHALSVRTTLDAELQQKVQELLDQRLKDVAEYGLRNGGVLVADHTTAEALSWAVAGEALDDVPEYGYDAVRTPRQPGSTLKPFVYALALDTGWSPATMIKDEPIPEPVEHGLHVYRNFSQTYYGMVPLAEALGNSLNTPAIRTIDFVGPDTFHAMLRSLGMNSLTKGIETYGKGLVLGNAEITLLELVEAYAALARGGVPMQIKVLEEEGDNRTENSQRILSERAAVTIGSILSEADYRQLEFGQQSVLDFPVRTAVKTGTSTEGNDVWTVAYDGRYVVGIWFGNMDRSSPAGLITGAGGPALLARSIFAELRRRFGLHPLPTIPLPNVRAGVAPQAAEEQIRMTVPTEDMEILLDPRIPQAAQLVPFSISGLNSSDMVEWHVDGKKQLKPGAEKLMWPVSLGKHVVSARVERNSGMAVNLPPRSVTVR